MLQEILKQETQTYHDRLEQLMFVGDIMSGSLTAARYQKLLITNYLSHYCFEEQLHGQLSENLRKELSIDERKKLPALLQDIEELLVPIPQLPPDASLLSLKPGDAGLLGAMYVLEGATLGGHVIVKKLLQNTHLQPLDFNYHYYQIYGPELIPRWKHFCEVLNTRVAPDDYDKAVSGAKTMFENMERLAKKCLMC